MTLVLLMELNSVEITGGHTQTAADAAVH
jgi:hypothetical protein